MDNVSLDSFIGYLVFFLSGFVSSSLADVAVFGEVASVKDSIRCRICFFTSCTEMRSAHT